MKLNNPALLRDKAYINGQWVEAKGGQKTPVINPATGQKIAEVPRCSAQDTEIAIAGARKAFDLWSKRLAGECAKILKKWHQLILKNQDDLALLMTLEQGKPLSEAKGEVLYGASFVEWFSEQARRLDGDILPSFNQSSRVLVLKQPVGPTAGITPWNFPMAMITRKASPAIAAGCTMIIKPAEATPLSALALAELAEQAGLPKAVLSIVTGAREDADEIGKILTTHRDIRKIGFTGSTHVGKKLMAQCAQTVKKLSLELGGNAPLIVFDDADLNLAVENTIICKFRNAGQTCVCANRILVQDTIFDRFVELLGKAISQFKLGHGTDEGVTMGPLINDAALDKVQSLVDQARTSGAKILLGGEPSSLGGYFYQPSLLTGVTTDMDITHQEIFGPVAPLIKFKDEQDAIKIANDTPFGLASYFFTRDLARSWRVGEALESGIVGLNSGIISSEIAPFGGVKESGLGREGSKYGIEEWVELKYMLMGGIN
ncbi:MAG: NAD-dependent succinate-semialdehyde dehydrogenase [Pseudomonadota bacterium]